MLVTGDVGGDGRLAFDRGEEPDFGAEGAETGESGRRDEKVPTPNRVSLRLPDPLATEDEVLKGHITGESPPVKLDPTYDERSRFRATLAGLV